MREALAGLLIRVARFIDPPTVTEQQATATQWAFLFCGIGIRLSAAVAFSFAVVGVLLSDGSYLEPTLLATGTAWCLMFVALAIHRYRIRRSIEGRG